MEDCDGEVNDDSKISNSCGNLGIFSGRHPERFAIYFNFFFFLAGRNDAMSRLLFDVQLKNQELVLQTMCKSGPVFQSPIKLILDNWKL